ncbi:hypothetical protein ACHAWF_007414 [Thalassiosira exigua]
MYVGFVLVVLVADVYHRKVMLPRLQESAEAREHQRQLDAGAEASRRAGDALNAFASSAASEGVLNLDDRMGMGAAGSVGGSDGGIARGGTGAAGDDHTHVSAPTRMMLTEEEMACAGCDDPVVKNRALNAVLTALSNYNDDEGGLGDDDGSLDDRGRADGWGVESADEGPRAWDRPVVLRGADGILARHPHHRPRTGDEDGGGNDFQSPYVVMEDMEALDRLCVQEGSGGHPAYNWRGAWHDGKQELAVHFRECWRDIVDDDESGRLEKMLLICEFPMTILRKLTVSIPCEGSYCRALVALSFALSPLWLGVYLLENFDVNLWGWQMGVFMAGTTLVGAMIMRYAPGGEGNMATVVAVSFFHR